MQTSAQMSRHEDSSCSCKAFLWDLVMDPFWILVGWFYGSLLGIWWYVLGSRLGAHGLEIRPESTPKALRELSPKLENTGSVPEVLPLLSSPRFCGNPCILDLAGIPQNSSQTAGGIVVREGATLQSRPLDTWRADESSLPPHNKDPQPPDNKCAPNTYRLLYIYI